MDVINNIVSGLSVSLIFSLTVSKTEEWYEKKIKKEYTLWNILEGNVWVKVNNREYLATSGDIVLFYPNNKCNAHTDKSGCKFLYSRFTLEMGDTIDLMTGINLAGVIPKQYLGKKSTSFARQFCNLSTGIQRITLRQYTLFLSIITDIIYIGIKHDYPRFFDSTVTAQESKVRQIADYIAEHCTEDLSINQIASHFNLSEKYFISRFKSAIGIAPKQYLIQCRMKLSAAMITENKYSMGEIAQITGYSDLYSFSKAFKKYYDESPSSFRNHFLYGTSK